MFYSVRICYNWKTFQGDFNVLAFVRFFFLFNLKELILKMCHNYKFIKNKYLKNAIFILNNQFRVKQSLEV